jgi:hypothetical protein
MNRLIKNLYETDAIKLISNDESWNNINESEFIELQGKFIPNPIVNSLMRFDSLFDMLIRFSEQKLIPPFDTLDNPPIPPNLHGKQIQNYKKELKKNAEKQLKDFKSLKDMLNGIKEDLETNKDFQKYVIEVKNLSDHKIVTYLFNEFMRDRAGAELPYGEFKIIGKVVRKIEGNESIDLLEGTALGLSDEMIESLKTPLKDMEGGQFKIPEIFTEVKSPAMQIIPIAIFV